MSKLRLKISMSLDGFVAGPRQSVDNPLGIGGERLHDWAIALDAWRKAHGEAGGETNESSRVMEESLVNIGATIMGRNMFGGHPGPWNTDAPWNGWWGKNPPFHHAVFVLTHHAREPLVLEGGTTFTFVTDGVESAVAHAKAAAGKKAIQVVGGVSVVQQLLQAGLVDELHIDVMPVLLGAGLPLFNNKALERIQLEKIDVQETGARTTLRFRVKK